MQMGVNGGSFMGCLHTRSTMAHPSVAMTSAMAVVSWTAWPC